MKLDFRVISGIIAAILLVIALPVIMKCSQAYMSASDRPFLEKVAVIWDTLGEVVLQESLTDEQLSEREGRFILPRELVEAAKNNDAPKIDAALKAGMDVNATDYTIKMTMLHHAASKGHLALVKYLIKSGANVNAKDEDNSTPLHFAAYRRGNIDVLNYLLEQGAVPNLVDDERLTPLGYAELARDPVMIDALKKRMAK